jgi:thiol-disulfide isomerase/thioredoxin
MCLRYFLVALRYNIFFISLSICNGQTEKVVLINKNSDWRGSMFSLWNELSHIPTMYAEMLANGRIDTAKYILEIPTKQPLFFNFSWNFKTQLVCLFPGDTLEFKSTEDENLPFVFSGTRPEQELMFYSELEKSNLGFLASSTNYDLEVTSKLNYQYISDETFKRYQKKLKLLRFKSNGNGFSQRGLSTISKGLYYQYLTELLFPYQPWKPIIENKKNDVFVPESYKVKLKELEIELDNDSLMYLLDYRRFIVAYARFLTIQSVKSSTIDLAVLLNYYEKTFSGKIKDCLLFDEVYGEYQKSGETSYFSKTISQLSDESLRNRLIQIQSKVIREFSANSLSEELTDSNGTKIRLGEFLIKNYGKMIYLDFWATWCGPCLIEMPYSNKLVTEFKNSNIVFAYISIDKDYNSWSKKLATLPKGENVYHFILSDSSKLKTEINVPPIPKYILIGKNSVVNFNAPRPGSKELREIILRND